MSERIILSKTREALVALVTAAAGTTPVYEAKNSAEKAAPNVSCGAVDVQEDPPGSGNFWVTAVVEVKSPMAVDTDGTDPKAAADELSADVFAALEVDDLADQLTAAVDNYTVFGIGPEKTFDEGPDGDCWVETWKRKIYCAGIAA